MVYVVLTVMFVVGKSTLVFSGTSTSYMYIDNTPTYGLPDFLVVPAPQVYGYACPGGRACCFIFIIMCGQIMISF